MDCRRSRPVVEAASEFNAFMTKTIRVTWHLARSVFISEARSTQPRNGIGNNRYFVARCRCLPVFTDNRIREIVGCGGNVTRRGREF